MFFNPAAEYLGNIYLFKTWTTKIFEVAHKNIKFIVKHYLADDAGNVKHWVLFL